MFAVQRQQGCVGSGMHAHSPTLAFMNMRVIWDYYWSSTSYLNESYLQPILHAVQPASAAEKHSPEFMNFTTLRQNNGWQLSLGNRINYETTI